MAVLTQYAARNGFTVARWLGPTVDHGNISTANLGAPLDSFKTQETMNARYGADGTGGVFVPPFNAKGWPSGAMQHGEAFSLPAQNGDVVYDLWVGGFLDEIKQPGVNSGADISQQDLEDCHFLWNTRGSSLWQNLKAKHDLLFFGVPSPTPADPPKPPLPPPNPPPVPEPALSPAAERINQLRTTLLELTKDGRFPATRKLSLDFWPIIKPFFVDLLKTYRRLRAHLGDPRPLPKGE